jgi:hypothetical protein
LGTFAGAQDKKWHLKNKNPIYFYNAAGDTIGFTLAAGGNAITSNRTLTLPATVNASYQVFDVTGRSFQNIIRQYGYNPDDFTGGLAAAIDSASADTAAIVISSEQTITTNLTVPSHVGLYFLEGGRIVSATAKTLTINGYLDGGVSRVFGDSITVRGTATPKVWRPEWFGDCVASGSIDCAQELNAIFALVASNGEAVRGTRKLELLPGVYSYTEDLIIPSAANNLNFYGTGDTSTILRAVGQAQMTVNTGGMQLHDMRIDSSPTLGAGPSKYFTGADSFWVTAGAVAQGEYDIYRVKVYDSYEVGFYFGDINQLRFRDSWVFTAQGAVFDEPAGGGTITDQIRFDNVHFLPRQTTDKVLYGIKIAGASGWVEISECEFGEVDSLNGAAIWARGVRNLNVSNSFFEAVLVCVDIDRSPSGIGQFDRRSASLNFYGNTISQKSGDSTTVIRAGELAVLNWGWNQIDASGGEFVVLESKKDSVQVINVGPTAQSLLGITGPTISYDWDLPGQNLPLMQWPLSGRSGAADAISHNPLLMSNTRYRDKDSDFIDLNTQGANGIIYYEKDGSPLFSVDSLGQMGLGLAAVNGNQLTVDEEIQIRDDSKNLTITDEGLSSNNVGYIQMSLNGANHTAGVTSSSFTIDADGTWTAGDHDLEISNGATYSEIDAGEASFTTSSSRSMKTNFKPLFPHGIPYLGNLNFYKYQWKETGQPGIGTTSDEWNKVFGREDDGNIDYHEVIITLLAKVAELERKVDLRPVRMAPAMKK